MDRNILPPGLAGYVMAQQQGQHNTTNQIQQLGGLMQLQNAQRQAAMDEQTAPLRLRLMQAQVGSAENPAPILKDLGGSIGVFDSRTFQQIGSLPKTATPDTLAKEAGSTQRHATPSGSALLGGQVTMRGQDMTDSRTRYEGAANRGVTVRGQDMTDQRAAAALERGSVPAGYRAVPGGLEPIPGGPATAKAQSSDTERVSAGYATRMAEAGKIMAGLEKKGIGKPGAVEAIAATVPGVGKFASNVAMSPDRQLYRQAQEDWVRAKLRKESGAVIADEEMDREIRVYFPQMGDSPQVMQQKANARAISEAGMVQAAGRATPLTRREPAVQGWGIREIK
jgi:hypothetical protein